MNITATVRNVILLAGLAGLAGCGGSVAEDAAAASASSAPHTGTTLESATRIHATIQDSLSSGNNKPGDIVRAIVSRSVSDSGGGVVIPAGSSITLTIGAIEPGSARVRPEGRLELRVSSVSVNGRDQALIAVLQPVAYHMAGRGTNTRDSAKGDAGAVISDLVVSAGTPIVFTLSNTLNVTAR